MDMKYRKKFLFARYIDNNYCFWCQRTMMKHIFGLFSLKNKFEENSSVVKGANYKSYTRPPVFDITRVDDILDYTRLSNKGNVHFTSNLLKKI